MANGNGQNNIFRFLGYLGALLVAAGILVSLGKVLETVEYQAKEDAEFNVRVAQIQEQIIGLQAYVDVQTQQRYRSTDAQRDMAYVKERLENIEEMVGELKKRLRDVERQRAARDEN